MNHSVVYRINLDINDGLPFGYVVFDSLQKAEAIYEALIDKSCFAIGLIDLDKVIIGGKHYDDFTNAQIEYKPTISLIEEVIDQKATIVAERLISSHFLGDEILEATKDKENEVLYDHIGYFRIGGTL